MTDTLLDRLEHALRQALVHNENAEVPPVALLWPDRDRQFQPAAERLRDRLPVLTLGDYEPARASGPAYWLRCAVAGSIDIDRQEGPPIIYLPGFSRDDLRGAEDCPRELAPLAGLQHRSQWFSHPNGRDWTVLGYLVNGGHGLGLRVSSDPATISALRGAVDELLQLPMSRLQAEYIDADFLHRLLSPDPTGALLEWLNDPQGYRARLGDEQWRAFVAQCEHDFDFEPATEGEVIGGRRLGERIGAWSHVWDRYANAPESYPGVESRLRMGKPIDEMFVGAPGAWPQDNERDESLLRDALAALATEPAGEARRRIADLWAEHRQRRNFVWARLGKAPLMFALEQLKRLADASSGGPHGGVDELTTAYTTDGWQADDALLAALAAAPSSDDRPAVAGAARALYRPWVEAHAIALQHAIGPLGGAGTYEPGPQASTEAGTITVFVDGLRLDLAHRLADRLATLDIHLDTTLAALPTVTPTAKPALTPVPAGTLAPGGDLAPQRASSGATATIAVLRSLMAERGVQVIGTDDTGDTNGTGWTEAGDIDRRGHEFGLAMVDDLDHALDRIAKRVSALIDAGWGQVDVLTDHGWLLLPGGLEKVGLPDAATKLKKGRCARLKEGAHVDVPTVPWHWDHDVRIALAPGIGCFEAGKDYEHGGVSLQECVVPRLRVRAASVRAETSGALISRVTWLGLMCRVDFENIAPGATLDIRTLPGDPTTSLADDTKETTGAGRASLFVADEDREGERAFIVIVSDGGRILAQRDVLIGSNR